MQSINAKEMLKEDFRDYLKTKSTDFLVALEKTGYKALGSERHQQVQDELVERENAIHEDSEAFWADDQDG